MTLVRNKVQLEIAIEPWVIAKKTKRRDRKGEINPANWQSMEQKQKTYQADKEVSGYGNG